ncbi:Crp/Fnr family transcriptional regulator [Desulfovibrio inopinatus]|uniref:Crp/Fnr family transcriptional regulator n=1 Tax=Desulfovibrio inopinatus TaxID=102109 RepID=UPI00041B9F7C|nr:Crp/Fnr family transcriptional regulator [Desulfovibrio inopinatus]
MDTLTALSTLTLFHGIPQNGLRQLASIAESMKCQRSDIIFEEDTPGRGFYGVVTGKIRIFKTSFTGKEHIIHVFGPGEIFAEVAMFTDQKYPATAQALEDSTCLFFPRDAFRQLLAEHPDLALAMLGLMSVRLRQLTAKIEALSLKEAPARFAAHLLLLLDEANHNVVQLDLSRTHLAGYLGANPETLSRIIKKMTENGYIVAKGKTVNVLDKNGLALLASGETLL